MMRFYLLNTTKISIRDGVNATVPEFPAGFEGTEYVGAYFDNKVIVKTSVDLGLGFSTGGNNTGEIDQESNPQRLTISQAADLLGLPVSDLLDIWAIRGQT